LSELWLADRTIGEIVSEVHGSPGQPKRAASGGRGVQIGRD
jgi:hypothetical protein